MTASPDPRDEGESRGERDPRVPRDPRKVPPAGDADAVPDTPYIAAHGSEPNSPPLQDPGVERRQSPRGVAKGGGVNTMVWVVIAIVAIAAVVYYIGFG